jgi:hypothetical protein
MPLPKKNEKQNAYVARYMSSTEAQKSFPDEKQRLAVAYSEYRHKGMSNAVKKHIKGK